MNEPWMMMMMIYTGITQVQISSTANDQACN